MKFVLKSKFKASDHQKEAFTKLTEGYGKFPIQTLLGITGSGKTFTVANLIAQVQKPTLILAHNKTLAAQLYQELKEFFPRNKVEYYVSYYDYYQPESYVPTTQTYIEKEATINSEIERMKLRTMTSLLSREDTIVISSISCIYGAGNPKDFNQMSINLKIGEKITREKLLTHFVNMLYERNNTSLEIGKFRVRGDVIDIFPPYEKSLIRIELFDDEVENITQIDFITYEKISSYEKIIIFPAKMFVVPETKFETAKKRILEELDKRVSELDLLEAQRLKQKVKYDLEMIEEVGYCNGIENYSRHFDNRKPGEPPFVLLDYFPKDFLFIIDESHQTLPQSRAMFNSDFSRKSNLVEFGFRLPSAFDNRPLKFKEFEKYFTNLVCVSATPAEYEITHSGQIVEQIIRPTGLLDPKVEILPCIDQVKDLIKQIKPVIEKNQRVLVTALTKKMAEDLTNFLAKKGIKVRYMHSDIDSLDRIELIRQLRIGEFDVLIGINLLREGLDLPEVSLVTILDGDKEGFLRDERSLIQTIGRAARNENGKVIIYADKITKSIKKAVEKTQKRREFQKEYNKKNNITPKTIIKKVDENVKTIKGIKHLAKEDVNKKLIELDSEMKKTAQNLDFERAIELRDIINNLKKEFELESKKK